MNPAPVSSWYSLLEGVVCLTKPATIQDRETVLAKLVDLCSDPAIAARVVAAASRKASAILAIAPELYWAAQLTLLGGGKTVH
ncbi:MAG: hypothetical protein BGP25_05090 [Lysobacterales bacterium 63-13]|nr:MAG: hypothetical protein BGP25_05090 [Xanthomonadales bacterium 63-13]